MAGLSHVTVKVAGHRELVIALEKLKKGVRNRVVRLALNKEQTPMLKMARQLAPKDSGTLKKSLGRRQKTSGSKVVVYVGPRRGYEGRVMVGRGKAKRSRYVNPIKYAHLADSGAKPHVIKPRKKRLLAFPASDGRMIVTRKVLHWGAKGKPFLSAAWESLGSLAKPRLMQSIREGVEREAAKVASKAGVKGGR